MDQTAPIDEDTTVGDKCLSKQQNITDVMSKSNHTPSNLQLQDSFDLPPPPPDSPPPDLPMPGKELAMTKEDDGNDSKNLEAPVLEDGFDEIQKPDFEKIFGVHLRRM